MWQKFIDLRNEIGNAKRHKLVGSTPKILENNFCKFCITFMKMSTVKTYINHSILDTIIYRFTCFIVFSNELCQVQLHLFLFLIHMKSQCEQLATEQVAANLMYISVILQGALKFPLILSARHAYSVFFAVTVYSTINQDLTFLFNYCHTDIVFACYKVI